MLGVPLNYVFVLSLVVFMIGLIGFAFNRKNFISMLFCLELMFMAANLNFIAGGEYFALPEGQIFVLFILALLAVELALGLIIAFILMKHSNIADIEDL